MRTGMMRKDENRDKYYMPETSDQHDLYFGTRETLFTLSFSPAYDLSKNKSSRRICCCEFVVPNEWLFQAIHAHFWVYVQQPVEGCYFAPV